MMHGGNRWTAGLREDGGQALVEFAVSLSILLTSIFVLIEICLMFYTYSTISECAREGTRYAMVRGSACLTGGGASCTATASSINSYVANLGYPNAGGGTMVVATTFSADGTTFTTSGNNDPNDVVRVDIKYSFPIRLPFVPRNAVNLESQSQMIILQ